MSITIIREIEAASHVSWQDALEKGLARALRTLRGITLVEVISERAKVEDGRIKKFTVRLNLHFTLEE